MIIFSFLLMGKLIYIQVFEGERYKVIASNQTVKNVVLQPSRGNIYSEDGSLMATSVAQYEVRWDSKVPSNSLYNNGKENGLWQWNGRKIWLSVCEDMWHSQFHQDRPDPFSENQQSIDLIVNIL